MKPAKRLSLISLLLALVLPGLAHADALELAAPGPCAEPRNDDLRAEPVYGTANPGFEIAGAAAQHFDPVDVAADSVSVVSSAFPEPPVFDRTPCSTDPGCSLLAAGSRISESAVEPAGPPGAP